MTRRDYVIVGLVSLVGAAVVALMSIGLGGVDIWVGVLSGLLYVVLVVVMTPRWRRPERREDGPS
jgi:predicted small integral membrane protein